MPGPKKTMLLSAAECARRTGLTVRALRVYERQGLIEPARSAQGWRCYGPKELQRLGVIVTLKTFGMTLAQIRSLLQTRPPSLANVLEMQLRVCQSRRDEAQRALELAQAALATMASGQSLTLEELCHLTRGMEMGNHRALVRELINEQITPGEERAYMTWMAGRPVEEVKAMQAYGAAMRVLFRSLQELRDNKVEPSAPRAQALVSEWNALAVRHGLRQRMAALLEWNPDLGRKWLRVGETVLSRSIAGDDGLWAYFKAAQEASPWYAATEQIIAEAETFVSDAVAPSSASAVALAQRWMQVCADYALGDPVVYARWAGAMQFRGSAAENARRKAAWAYLSDTLQTSQSS